MKLVQTSLGIKKVFCLLSLHRLKRQQPGSKWKAALNLRVQATAQVINTHARTLTYRTWTTRNSELREHWWMKVRHLAPLPRKRIPPWWTRKTHTSWAWWKRQGPTSRSTDSLEVWKWPWKAEYRDATSDGANRFVRFVILCMCVNDHLLCSPTCPRLEGRIRRLPGIHIHRSWRKRNERPNLEDRKARLTSGSKAHEGRRRHTSRQLHYFATPLR